MATNDGQDILSRAFLNTVTNAQGRFVLKGSTDGTILLPTGDNPNDTNTVIGISLEGNGNNTEESVRLRGSAPVEVNGTATQGTYAIVLNGGKGSNLVQNATPVVQTVGGVWMGTGVTGDLIECFIDPQFITA